MSGPGGRPGRIVTGAEMDVWWNKNRSSFNFPPK